MEQFKDDLRAGRIDVDQLVDFVAKLQQRLQAADQELQAANQELLAANKRIEELEKQLGGGGAAKKIDEPFSLRAEEKRQEARGKKKRKPKPKKRRGRTKTADKIAQAERSEDVFPDGVDRSKCKLSHTRPVWRLENGRAALVAYHIYRGPKNQYGKIPGVLGRSEFGLEFVVEVAYLVNVMGLSLDKVCHVVTFFQDLHLCKSQAESLLRQLSRHWEMEFDALCTLLANSLVVYADETSWSVNSAWAFLSEKARVLLFGVPKDGETLKAFLDPETFAGILVSDDASVYGNFTHSQKCWAHLLRKAIKLTLQDKDNEGYRHFTDRLLEIYHKARRLQRDQRYSDAGRAAKVGDLNDELVDLCWPIWSLQLPPLEGLDGDFRLLVNELMRLMLTEQLFTFVTAKAAEQPNGDSRSVSGTNNEAERTLRGVAEARKTGRTSKTAAGARRRTVVTSVLESLRLYLPTFTLASVIEEINSWLQVGQSCFEQLLERLKLKPLTESVLDQIMPNPDG